MDLPNFTAKHSSSEPRSPPAFMHIFTFRRIFKPCDFFKTSILSWICWLGNEFLNQYPQQKHLHHNSWMPKRLVLHGWKKLFKYTAICPFTTKLYLIIGVSKQKRQQEFKTKTPCLFAIVVGGLCLGFLKVVWSPRSNCIFIVHINLKTSYYTEIGQVYFFNSTDFGANWWDFLAQF